MKLNLSRKQLVFALLYSAIFPIATQIDMQTTVYEGVMNHKPMMSFYSAVITFPFLPIGFFGGSLIAKNIFGGIEFMSVSMYFSILLQVVLVIHLLNRRKNKKNNNKISNKYEETNSLP
ncbi:MAG: hypothetical protein ACI8WT_004952 [Clostridium sp.]|jgi:hypothetical protein